MSKRERKKERKGERENGGMNRRKKGDKIKKRENK